MLLIWCENVCVTMMRPFEVFVTITMIRLFEVLKILNELRVHVCTIAIGFLVFSWTAGAEHAEEAKGRFLNLVLSVWRIRQWRKKETKSTFPLQTHS